MTQPTPATTRPITPKMSPTRTCLTYDAPHAFRTAN
jgi:hypothetical protein